MKLMKGLIQAALLSTIFVGAAPSWGQTSSSAQATSGTTILAPANLVVVSDLLLQTGMRITLTGSGDTVSFAVPGTLNLLSGVNQALLPLKVMVASSIVDGGTLLTEDTVNVQVDGGLQGNTPGRYEGVMLVLAQYN